MNDTTTPDKITQLEARVHWLEQKLYLACDNLHKLGFEKDGPNKTIERFGVEANACRRILDAIGPWQRTNFDSIQALQLPVPNIREQQQRKDAHMFNKVEWSKDPSFRF